MKNTKSTKYLGDIMYTNDTFQATIENRQKKGEGIIAKILSIINEISLGRHKYEVAMKLREAMLLTLKLPGVRSKFKTKYYLIFLLKLYNFLHMFSVAIHSLCIKEKMYQFRIPRKNQQWVYFYLSNLKVGPFGPPPVALGSNYVLFNSNVGHGVSHAQIVKLEQFDKALLRGIYILAQRRINFINNILDRNDAKLV